MKFTSTVVDQLVATLGYESGTDFAANNAFAVIVKSLLDRDFSQYSITRVQQLLFDLDDIDEKLRSARSDYMAKEVGNLKLDFRQYVGLLKADGSRILKEIEQLLKIPIAYNRYKPNSSAKVSYW